MLHEKRRRLRKMALGGSFCATNTSKEFLLSMSWPEN